MDLDKEREQNFKKSLLFETVTMFNKLFLDKIYIYFVNELIIVDYISNCTKSNVTVYYLSVKSLEENVNKFIKNYLLCYVDFPTLDIKEIFQ